MNKLIASFAMVFAVMLAAAALARAAEEKEAKKPKEAAEEKVALDKLPQAVTDAVKAKFPKAELVSAGSETENDKPVFEVKLKDGKTVIEVTLTPEGKIVVVEKEIAAKDLPKEVAEALEAKYPNATITKVEEIVKDDSMTTYEMLIVTAEKKKLEVQFDPKGKFLEEEQKGGAKDEDDDDDKAEKKKDQKSDN